jgi:hypothetical protein
VEIAVAERRVAESLDQLCVALRHQRLLHVLLQFKKG